MTDNKMHIFQSQHDQEINGITIPSIYLNFNGYADCPACGGKNTVEIYKTVECASCLRCQFTMLGDEHLAHKLQRGHYQ